MVFESCFYKDSEKARAVANENGIFKFDKADPPPVFYKDRKRRKERQMKT